MKVVIQLDPWSTKTELDSHSQSLYISFTAVNHWTNVDTKTGEMESNDPCLLLSIDPFGIDTFTKDQIASWHGTATTVRLTLICNQSTRKWPQLTIMITRMDPFKSSDNVKYSASLRCTYEISAKSSSSLSVFGIFVLMKKLTRLNSGEWFCFH